MGWLPDVPVVVHPCNRYSFCSSRDHCHVWALNLYNSLPSFWGGQGNLSEPWFVEVRKELLETVDVVTNSADRKARSGSLTRGKAGRKVDKGKVPSTPMVPLTVELPRPQAIISTLPLGRSNSIGRANYNDRWRCAPLDDDKDVEKVGDEDDDDVLHL